MKLSDAKMTYTFSDFLLVPQYSEIKSRKSPDVSSKLGDMKLKIPIIASPMNTITEWQMMMAMTHFGGSSVLHRYMSVEDQRKQIIAATKSGSENFFVAIGASGDYLDRAKRLYDELNVQHFCVDVANGHNKLCLDAVEQLVKLGLNVMAGNVATYEGIYRLANAGATSVRVGIGSSSVCKTRVVSGCGIPQLSALEDCVRIKDQFPNVSVISDGGIRNSGDMVKALAMGADVVMLGSLLAGTTETPGKVVNGQKLLAGMASSQGRKYNGWFSEEDADFVPEGEAFMVSLQGSVENVIKNLVGGLKVGMSYLGANNLKQLRENAEWVRVSNASAYESTPYGKK